MRAAVFALALLLPAPALAEGLTFDALGHTLSFPLPAWSGMTPIPVDGLETFTDTNATEALIEYIPQGESFEAWQHLYTARIWLNPDLALSAYRDATAEGYTKICEEDATLFALGGTDTDTSIAPIAHACGRHKPGLGLDGQGQLMLTIFRKTEKGLAIVSQEWRAPAFDVADDSTWPVPPDTLLALAGAVDGEVSLVAAP